MREELKDVDETEKCTAHRWHWHRLRNWRAILAIILMVTWITLVMTVRVHNVWESLGIYAVWGVAMLLLVLPRRRR